MWSSLGAWAEVWTNRQVLGPNNADYPFAGIYEYDNLSIGRNVEVTSSNISHLVIRVTGRLTMGSNAVIRVRNGYYSQAPQIPLSAVTPDNLNTLGLDAGGFRLYPDMFGKGSDGGAGSPGWGCISTQTCGMGGGGGFGGGSSASNGLPQGGCCSIGLNGTNNPNGPSQAGRGNGGCSGGGSFVHPYSDSQCYSIAFSQCGPPGHGDPMCIQMYFSQCMNMVCGSYGAGGGGGGYGGGILTILADEIQYEPQAPPKFLVSGQRGCADENGQGGMLIMQARQYLSASNHWSLGSYSSYGTHDPSAPNGGHGVVTGDPQKVFLLSPPPSRPRILSSSLLFTNKQFQFTLSGETGRVCEIWASTNLPQFWLLHVLTNSAGLVPFTDPEIGLEQRFYQVRQQ